ncbi:MAG TPA: CPBP family intramembrane metalloprotease, partial [Casimicrobium sp.]|nr:CPBP family intramembrane metalloprotease [Casimicrobium sp.]
GWHAGWNWLLAVGFEVPVTGLDAKMPALLVKLVPQGSVYLTGGTQGPEGSVLCGLFFVVGIAVLLVRDRVPRSGNGTKL